MAHQISLLSFFILLILTEVSIQLQDQEGCECPTGEINAGGCTYDNPKRCQPCPWGHFWYKPEGTESPRCWPCSKCTRMDEKPFQPCTPTSDTVCRCIHGTYLRHQSSFYCTPHSSCSAGKYVAITGSHLQDNLCKECPQGTFTDKRNKATSCTPYTDCAALNMTKIYPGNNSHDSVCGTQGSGFKDLAHLSTYTMKLHQGTTTNSYRSKQKERNITLPTKVVPPSGAGHPSVLVVAFLVVTPLLSIFILLFVVVGIWRRRNHFLTNGKNQIGAGLQDPERQVLQPRALSHVGSQQEEVNEQRVINEDETTAQDGREHTHLVQEDVTVDEDSKSSPCLEDVESEVCQTRKLVMQTHVSATSSALVPGDRTQECQSLDLNKNENKQGRQEVQKYLDLQGLACVNHGEQQTKQLGASRNENPNGFSNLIPGPLEEFGSKPAQVKVMGSCSKTVTPGEVHSRSVQDDHEKAKMSDNWAFKVFVEIMSQTVQWNYLKGEGKTFSPPKWGKLC